MKRASSNLAFDRLVACDELVAKALGVSEISQIARSETRMREYLTSKWDELSARAIQRAVALGKAGASAKEISAAIDRVMEGWAKEVEQRYLEEFTRIYYRARSAGWKKVNGLTREKLTYDIPEGKAAVEKASGGKLVQIKPFFDVIDERAVEALRGHQTLWIGSHYDEKVSSGIARTAKEWVVEAGKHPREAAGVLKDRLTEALGKVEVPKGYTGSAKSYFEGVAANAATVARVQGQMRSFIDYGVTTYEIVNPRDSRTCEECIHMDGKTFSVRQGADVMEESLSAKTPEQVKSAQPWMNIGQIREISSTAGKAGPEDASKLAEARFCLPPFHFKCRCTVDVSEDAGSWRLAGPSEEPPVPKPPEPSPEAPPKPKFKPPPEVPKPAPQPIPLSEKRPTPRSRRKPAPAEEPIPAGRPQSFPPLKQTPGTPNEEFSLKRYAEYLSKSKGETIEHQAYKYGREVRREMAAICAENKMYYRDIDKYTGRSKNQPNKKRIYQLLSKTEGQAHYTGGSHYTYLGDIHIGTGAWDDMMAWAKTYAANPKTYDLSTGISKKARWGFEATLHEVVHGHGPTMNVSAYNKLSTTLRKTAMMLEEVMTDSATRWMSIKKLGGTTWDYQINKFQPSAYDSGIKFFAEKINSAASKHLGKFWNKICDEASKLPETKNSRLGAAYRVLFDSAIRFKREMATQIGTVDDFYSLWASNIELPPEAFAGMTKAQSDKVIKEIRKEMAALWKEKDAVSKANEIITYIKEP